MTMTEAATGSLQSGLTGRCLCAAILYRCAPPLYPPTLCHCESCRRASGAHALGWITVPAGSFEITRGQPRIFKSSVGVERSFCGQCGTPLTYHHEHRSGEIDVTLGSLDHPEQTAPVDHIWMADALSWDRPEDGLPQHLAARTP